MYNLLHHFQVHHMLGLYNVHLHHYQSNYKIRNHHLHQKPASK